MPHLIVSTGVPVSKEPSGLSRSDGRRPDGLTPIQWRAGMSLIWDVLVFCTTADSYLEASSCEANAAAELTASNKVVKYAGLSSRGEFVPIAVESHDQCRDGKTLTPDTFTRPTSVSACVSCACDHARVVCV